MNETSTQSTADSFDLKKFFKSFFKLGDIPEDYSYYLVEGRGVNLTCGNQIHTDYTAVIAAPDKDHARALAQFEFITFKNSRATSLQELKAEIEAITYSWRSDHSHPQFDGWAKVDTLKFRCIENTKKITKAKANSLKKRSDVLGNVYRPDK